MFLDDFLTLKSHNENPQVRAVRVFRKSNFLVFRRQASRN